MSGNSGPSRPFPFRSLAWTLVVVGVGSGSVYLADRLVVEPQQARERHFQDELKKKQVELEALEKQRLALEKRTEELETFAKRLNYTERRAQVVVLNQQTSDDGQTNFELRFTEIDKDGNPVTQARDFTISGTEVYFDCLVVTFEDHFVEQGDALKGKPVMVFRRIFSDQLKPQDGYMLDREGKAPEIYARDSAASDVEREIWERFWELADNPKLAKERGIRSIHGKALYTKLAKDKIYIIEMRATGEMSIRPPSMLSN